MSDNLTIAYLLGAEQMRDKLHKQADEIERLRAENEKLREALGSFAEVADLFTDEAPNNYAVKEYLGRFRAARRALQTE